MTIQRATSQRAKGFAATENSLNGMKQIELDRGAVNENSVKFDVKYCVSLARKSFRVFVVFMLYLTSNDDDSFLRFTNCMCIYREYVIRIYTSFRKISVTIRIH